MTTKQKNSPIRFLKTINRRSLRRWLTLGLIVIIGLFSYYLYYSYINKKASQDFLFGTFLYRRGSEDPSKYEEAEKVFKDMLSCYRVRRWRDIALFYLGNTYYKKGDINEALKTYNLYLSRFPKGDWAKESIISLAYIEENKGRYGLAIEQYEKLLREFPEDYLLKEVYLGIGRSYERLKKFSLAREYYGKLKANYPGSAWAKKAEARLEEIGSATQAEKN